MADWTVFFYKWPLPIITSPLWSLSISVHKTFAIQQQQQRNKNPLNWFIVKNWTHYYRYCFYIYRTSTDPSHYIVDIPPYSHAWNIDMSFHITLHSTNITIVTSCSFSFPVLPTIDPFIIVVCTSPLVSIFTGFCLFFTVCLLTIRLFFFEVFLSFVGVACDVTFVSQVEILNDVTNTLKNDVPFVTNFLRK